MLRVMNLQMDYQHNPVGLDAMPQFGWELDSDRNNVVQKSYRLQLSTGSGFGQLVFDSGWVESDASAQVSVPDVTLETGTKYHARVMVSDGQETTDWFAGFFVTALISEGWQAPFISAETDDSYKTVSKGTMVRGRFCLRGPIREAYAFTTALGLYEFHLNGAKVGQDELTPGWTSYRRHLLYQTYEVTELLAEGENVAGAMLGDGWYKGEMGLTRARNNYGDQTGFAMQLLVRYQDGSQECFYTGPDWIGTDSPVVFADIYHGETYDAALEIPGWAKDKQPRQGNWRPVVQVPFDCRVVRAQSGGRVKMMDRMPAKKVFTTPKGETVIDFGQNMAGRIHLNAAGMAGEVIELRCFEVLDGDGNVYTTNLRNARTTMKYIFGRDGEISYHPRFTFMGFRYAQVLAWPGSPKAENFTAYALHSEMEPAGGLECSNPLLNQLHHNCLWGLKSNFLDVPTDCPQRDERLGWTGDAQIFARTSCYLMNTYTFFKKWLHDLAVDQTPEGGVPHVIPNIEEGKEEGNWLLAMGGHSSSAWADAAVINPWTLYLMYGDKEILKRQYASMKKWIDFMKDHTKDDMWSYRLQLGDWVALDAKDDDYFGATPTDLTCNAYYAYSTGLFVKIAKILGNKQDVEQYQQLYDRIVRKYQQVFFDENGKLTAQTQTAHIISLYFNLTPAAYLETTVQGLKKLLEKENGHLVTGFVGTPYFCLALSQYNCNKEAYELLLKEDYPSWLYQVKMGATTIWERWNSMMPDGSIHDGMNSFNHYAYGAIGEWMYRVMLGIDTDERGAGFKESIIWPRIGGGLSFVRGWHKTVYGKITVQWEEKDGQVALQVKLPPNTSGVIRLDQAGQIIDAGGLAFTQQDNYAQARAGSGQYRITYEKKNH